MRVLLFHPRPLPPRDYGGTERVVLWLARGLLELGHSVGIAAAPGSRLPPGIELIPTLPEETPAQWLPRVEGRFDVIHFHAPTPQWNAVTLPKLVTIHGNGQPGEVFPLNAVFLSQDHARRHQAQAYVYNGLDLAEYPMRSRHEDWYLFLAKTSWRVKNLRGAMRFCDRARASLKIAGGNRPLDLRLRSYFCGRYQWLGPVNGALKMELLGRARALLFPILWPEPFGLAMIEALACGTPVFAHPYGSVPEIITPDVGRLLNSESEWIEALQDRTTQWSAEACRARVVETFTNSKMAENYHSLYKKVIHGENLNPIPPKGLS